MLAERVARGELPPVEERLPAEPVVVEPVESIGVYGGTWRRLAVVATDFALRDRLAYEPLVRWDRTGRQIAPGAAKGWDILDGGRTYVLHLRKGMRWSDGAPFTSEDILFYYEDFLLNTEIMPVFPSWLAIGGEPVRVTAPDPQTVVFAFSEPYGIFLEMLAFRGNEMSIPKHYLKQFHPKYTPADELDRAVQAARFNHWRELFGQKNDANDNPERPVIAPFKISVPLPALRVIAERNPYYWKVDPAGNQLPYIDRIGFTVVQNREIGNFMAMTGEVDFQARFMDSANFTLFMENRDQGGYRVYRDLDPLSTVVYINQYSRDPVLRPILQDRRFRIALSVAINREELAEVIYMGLAQPSRGVASPYDPHHLPEFNEKYIEYDPELANRLLDEMGLERNSRGTRLLPDGKPFRQVLHCYPSELGTGADQWQLVADYWREIGLEFVVRFDAPGLSVMQVMGGNSDFWAYAIAGMHWIVDPLWYVPWASNSYHAPLYGQYVNSNGRSGVKPPSEFQRLVDWYLELRSLTGGDPRRLELGRNILRQWAEEVYVVGIVHQQQLTIVSNRFRNVPEEIIHSYRLMTPGYIGIEQFYIEDE